jgi:serine protease inhibitor
MQGDFGLALLERLGGEQDVVLSPYGLQRALDVVRAGTSGRTREALDRVLGDPPPAIELDDPSVELALATAAWLAPGYAPGPALTGLDTGPLDVDAVNAWAAKRTRGMIDRVVDGFSADVKLALTDAVYLDAAWTDPFDAALTRPAPFEGAGEVNMMRTTGKYAYAERDGVQAVRIPYGNTGALEFVALLGASTWRDLRFQKREGTIELPRFSAQFGVELTGPLVELGLGPAFEPGGDLEALFTGPGAKSLDQVFQRARADVDERGTRAAAVTVVTARAVSFNPNEPPPFHIVFDRPFLWAVEHRPTGALLFVGRVHTPVERSD